MLRLTILSLVGTRALFKVGALDKTSLTQIISLLPQKLTSLSSYSRCLQPPEGIGDGVGEPQATEQASAWREESDITAKKKNGLWPQRVGMLHVSFFSVSVMSLWS